MPPWREYDEWAVPGKDSYALFEKSECGVAGTLLAERMKENRLTFTLRVQDGVILIGHTYLGRQGLPIVCTGDTGFKGYALD